MDITSIREFLFPDSNSLAIWTAVAAAVMALREFSLKQKAARVEEDVKLIKAFVEIMPIAHARGPAMMLSDKVFDVVWPHLQKTGKIDPIDAAIVDAPVGAAAQDAAIAAVATLGLKHKILRKPAKQALESLLKVKPAIVGPYLKDFK